ncbi:unnamed protein product, partial [Polarella glacialis]
VLNEDEEVNQEQKTTTGSYLSAVKRSSEEVSSVLNATQAPLSRDDIFDFDDLPDFMGGSQEEAKRSASERDDLFDFDELPDFDEDEDYDHSITNLSIIGDEVRVPSEERAFNGVEDVPEHFAKPAICANSTFNEGSRGTIAIVITGRSAKAFSDGSSSHSSDTDTEDDSSSEEEEVDEPEQLPQSLFDDARARFVPCRTLPGHFRDTSGTLPGHFRDTSGTLPGHFRDTGAEEEKEKKEKKEEEDTGVWIWPPLAFGRALLDGCADLTSQSPWSYFLSDAGIFWAAGVTLLLLARGRSSPHLRSATGCALTIWLYSISAACNCLFTCRLGNVSQVTRIFDYLSSFFCFAGWVWIPVLVMTRISALEASMGQPLGLWEMRWVIFVTAVTTALCVIVVVYSWSLEFVPLPVIYVLASAYGVSSVLYLTFTGLVVRAFCTPLRLLREMHNAGYISKETWAAAVSLGQLQIGGLLASTTSTVLSAGSIIFGSALQLAKHDESGRDMFTYVAIPLWLDIIANSTCVLFLSGAVHMPNAVLGNALARQRNRAALLGNSMSVVDRKWHAKVSELAERGFTLESLLSFYKRLGTDYMLHYKPDVHRTSDVVRQAIIPLSRPSGVAYAVTMMKGACSLPDAIVTHNWGNLFRDLVAGICADALGLSEYALVSELLDCDVVALESMLANSGKIQKTYWVCGSTRSPGSVLTRDLQCFLKVCVLQ